MAAKIMYQIVGRYMSGKEVTGYHLQGNNGKSGRYTREQVCYLVGRDQITNCSGQIYQDKVLLRGVGISLEDLPVQQEDGTLSRTENIGKVRKNTSAADAMTQVMLTHSIVLGRQTVGYVVRNAGGASKNVSRDELLALAKAGRIGNARYQESNGKPILRGVGVNLNELPTIDAIQAGLVTQEQAQSLQSKSQSSQKPNSTSNTEASSIRVLLARVFDANRVLIGGVLMDPYSGMGYVESRKKIDKLVKEGKIANFAYTDDSIIMRGTDLEFYQLPAIHGALLENISLTELKKKAPYINDIDLMINNAKKRIAAGGSSHKTSQ